MANRLITSEGKTVLVTGAAGRVGAKLVELIAADGSSVVAVYRNTLPEMHDKVFPVCSNLKSAELLAAPLRGVDTVVHLAWDQSVVASEGGREGDDSKNREMQKSDLSNNQSLKNLLRASERAGVEQFLLVSAIGADSRSKSFFLREKYEAERLVLNSQIVRKVIFRSAPIISATPGDPLVDSIKKLLVVPGFYPLPRCNKTFEPVCVFDVAAAIGAMIKKEINTSEESAIYDIVGRQHFSIESLIKLVVESSSRSSKIAISSILGHSLIPLLQRDKSGVRAAPKLDHFFYLSRTTAPAMTKGSRVGLFWDNKNFLSIEHLFGE